MACQVFNSLDIVLIYSYKHVYTCFAQVIYAMYWYILPVMIVETTNGRIVIFSNRMYISPGSPS
jgi:hypothetical protein